MFCGPETTDVKTFCFPEVPVNKRFVIYQLSKKNKKVAFKEIFIIQTFFPASTKVAKAQSTSGFVIIGP